MEQLVTTDKVDRFEAAFNQIHLKLKEMVNDPREFVAYGEVLNRAKRLHNIVYYHYDILKKYGHLRNTIIHNKTNEAFYIADPHEEVVQDLERIRDLILKPPLAMSIASQPVMRFSKDTSLKEILAAINQTSYSQFPIYDEKDFIGLVTEGGIAKWCSRNLIGELLSIESVTAMDLLALEKMHNVAFIPRTSGIFDLEHVFEESFDRNEKLEAILITETGERHQLPIGIVTSWDLVCIDHTSLTLSSHV